MYTPIPSSKSLQSLRISPRISFPGLSLANNDKFIRVATIQPGRFDDDVVVSFKMRKLLADQDPAYEALSYVWGKEVFSPKQVIIRQSQARMHRINVTQNLDVAPRYLRYEDRSRNVSIDALCINQQDVAEKSSQLPMMGEVYSFAERVVVFPGEEGNNSTYALESLRYLGDRVEVNYAGGGMRPSSMASKDDVDLAKTNCWLPFEVDQIEAIEKLTQRPWFGRLWTRQEVLVANSSAIILCGRHSIPWPAFRKGLFCYSSKPKLRSLNETLDDTLFNLDLRYLFRVAGTLQLVKLHRFIGLGDCGNPKDRIYSSLSLLHDELWLLEIKPNCDDAISAFSVYQEIATKYMKLFDATDILECCFLRGRTSAIIDWKSKRFAQLPSWVPDWSTPCCRPYQHLTTPSGTLYPIGSEIIIDGNQLTIPAVRVGKITRAHPIPAKLELKTLGFGRLIVKLFPDGTLENPYPHGGTYLDALTRILYGDYFMDRYIPPRWGPDGSFEQCKIYLRKLYESGLNQREPTHVGADAYYWTQLLPAQEPDDMQALIYTDSGHQGIASALSQVGDEVWVILGCGAVMITRSLPVVSKSIPGHAHQDQKYENRLLGMCILPGAMDGEAFLGRLPDGVDERLRWNSKTGIMETVYVNSESGKILRRDPRLDRISSRWTLKKQGYQVGMEQLKRIGSAVEWLKLV